MTPEPVADHGQTIAPPAGKVIGFIDDKSEYEAFAKAVLAAGFPAAAITALYGEEGIHLLQRLKDNSFFFGDSEDNVIHLSIRELEQGHYAAAVEVADRQQAVQIADLAKPYGGHGFKYFGTWVSAYDLNCAWPSLPQRLFHPSTFFSGSRFVAEQSRELDQAISALTTEILKLSPLEDDALEPLNVTIRNALSRLALAIVAQASNTVAQGNQTQEMRHEEAMPVAPNM